MASLDQKMQLASEFFSREPAQYETRVYATATASSTDGTVTVDIGGEEVSIPAVGAIAQGQEAVVQVYNGHPFAIGAKGWGDEIQADVDEVTSHVWIDSNGNLRVTREPEDQNPTDGVTITNQAVDVASTDYTSELSDNGLTILKNDSIGQVMRMTSTFDGVNSLPSVMARRGLILIATDRTSLDNIGAAYDAIVIQPSPPSTGAYKDVVASIESLGLPVFQAKTDCIQFGGVQYDDVYPVATTSRLGPVKVGGGLAVTSAGVLSSTAGEWRAVSVTNRLPSGFDSVTNYIYANDTARLLYISLHAENSGGTNTSVPANQNIITSTDTSLYPANLPGAPISRIGSGFRYAGSLLDFPVRMFQWNTNTRTWGLRSPTWAFSAASISFDAVIPYDRLGIA